MNEYTTQRWKAPSAQLQLSASETGKPHDARVTRNFFTAGGHLVSIRGSQLARRFVSCAPLEIWKMFRCACTISGQDTEYSRPQRSMSHQPTGCSFFVYWCIRRTTPIETWSPAPFRGIRKGRNAYSQGSRIGSLDLRHGWKNPKIRTRIMRFVVGFRTWGSGCLTS